MTTWTITTRDHGTYDIEADYLETSPDERDLVFATNDSTTIARFNRNDIVAVIRQTTN